MQTLTPDTPGGLIITCVVTHPQGIAQVVGGTLKDPTTGTYGAFVVSTISGSFSINLTWTAIQTVRADTAASGSTTRVFQATFYDQAGHSTTQDVSINLQCSSTGLALCNGKCTDLQDNTGNCGACGHSCLALGSNVDSATLTCSGAKCSGLYSFTEQKSCAEACTSLGLTCRDGGFAFYKPNSSMHVSCTTVPLSGTTTQPFQSVRCGCTE